ncbi:hypothetical protein BD289DRAFT_57573 [Coniella lustricola]|uniref:Uncharacterized protein n=1 Tax=Coniella lustricola TaxID=2025994 RepID=A0A2T3AID6_9PEZI|nr:hypothetical protein BD289DRAFT_57573 [Coniella lustricola]
MRDGRKTERRGGDEKKKRGGRTCDRIFHHSGGFSTMLVVPRSSLGQLSPLSYTYSLVHDEVNYTAILRLTSLYLSDRLMLICYVPGSGLELGFQTLTSPFSPYLLRWGRLPVLLCSLGAVICLDSGLFQLSCRSERRWSAGNSALSLTRLGPCALACKTPRRQPAISAIETDESGCWGFQGFYSCTPYNHGM